MATLKINSGKIIDNIKKLDVLLQKYDKKWSLVLKVLGGHNDVLEKILKEPVVRNLYSVADSRLYNLKAIKAINPDITTMYIQPPTVKSAKTVVNHADISLNTQKRTIEALNREATKLGKIHKIIIMIELGELREGILRENTVDFYSKVFNLSNIEVIGLGTNLGCMYGVEPTYDKLMQLYLYKELIQAKFNKKLELISGGSSITLPLIRQKTLPKGLNHFRIGEAAFLGTSPFDNERFSNLSTEAFSFYANIIELEKKRMTPDGVICEGNVGHTADQEEEVDLSERHYRCILDFGALDVGEDDITPIDHSLKFIGTTSDMTVYDLGTRKKHLSVGDSVKFKPNYMAVARLMASNFIAKEVI